MTEFELFQALRPLYPAAEYALLPQVANATGQGNKRHCDALALSLWPSRGLHLSGFEMKSYRGDWLRELRNPEKAEEIAGKVNFWWIVASGPFVPIEELPPGWGLLTWDEKAGKLVKVKAAPFREADKLDLPFLAAALRQAQEVCTPAGTLAAEFKKGYNQGLKDGQVALDYEQQQAQEIAQSVKDFEKASGIRIRDRWQGGKAIGQAVADVMAGTVGNRQRALVNIAQAILKDFGDGEEE